ncbi:lipid IV(A) 3-deoxy-D-manno-octulosonic acid transferase [uncultured Thiothrix sp.]|uniref:lipid IV(A) 3-deoxy-D-manno-octulosonic acid transferase n=1 Tax=uncultured Thiothrix sp. TaxID=223185 RepID=UPI00261E42C8|nr:lipid IV(A) 3-deoxy-D-manno-octulosonic acid transferase [uncultured Thiothrix sp.]
MSLARFSYSCLLYLLLPFIFIKLGWRGRLNPAYRQAWGERLGYVKALKSKQPCICLHAVSVGETMAARPLIEQLLTRYSPYKLWITSTTPTGAATVERLFGSRVERSYLPYDTPAAVKRFLRQVQPHLLLVMETELWPNLYAACAQAKIPLVLVNARLSERSTRGYARVQNLTRETLAQMSLIAAREQLDAERFLALGATPKQLKVLGNIKFDIPIATEVKAQALELRRTWGERLVWVAASTHRGEDELILQAHKNLLKQFSDVLLILVPRHPERFVEVAALCEQAQLSYQRRSSAQVLANTSAVLLGDSMGELLLWYACADLAFVAGSLVDVGGHNPLEALAFGVPVISGNYIHNFQDIYPELVKRGVAVLVDSPTLLAHHLAAWLSNPTARQQAGRVGQDFLEQQRGVVERLLPDLDKLLSAKN